MSKNSIYTFTDVEQAIVQRLEWATQQQHGVLAPWCKKIRCAYNIEGALSDIEEDSPAIYLVYEGFSVLDKNPSQTLDAHRWLILLLIKSDIAQRNDASFYQKIGIYQHQIKSALKNFVSQGASQPLVEITPVPVKYEGGHVHYFFRYEARCLYSKDFGVGASVPTKLNNPF